MDQRVLKSALAHALVKREANISNWNFKQLPFLCWEDLAQQHSIFIQLKHVIMHIVL